MLQALFASLLLVASCGSGFTERDQAQQVIRGVFEKEGYDWPAWIGVIEYQQPCLPAPWNFGKDLDTDEWTLDDERCRTGRALYMVFACFIAIRHYEADPYSITSLAHEDMHCSSFDPYHEWNVTSWQMVVPAANHALEKLSL